MYHQSGDATNFFSAIQLVDAGMDGLMGGLQAMGRARAAANRDYGQAADYQEAHAALVAQYNELAVLAEQLMRRNQQLETEIALLESDARASDAIIAELRAGRL